ESLMMLALEGYVTKRHGSGNYVHPSAFDPTDRIDMGLTFADAFRLQGYEPGMKIISVSESLPEVEQMQLFQIEEQQVIASCEIIYTADELPSIYSVQKIPKTYLKNPFRIGEKRGDFFQFLEEYCELSIIHSLNEYKAVLVPERMENIFGIQKGTPVIYCAQLYYDIYDKPIFYNEHYFHPDRFGVKMLQNWDLNAK
ncbi:MAG: GntR family transcriptional regulator, partial [Lachnospiraceae bacterium]